MCGHDEERNSFLLFAFCVTAAVAALAAQVAAQGLALGNQIAALGTQIAALGVSMQSRRTPPRRLESMRCRKLPDLPTIFHLLQACGSRRLSLIFRACRACMVS